nr:hypothetical protein [uncultured Lichenicoccus sp.]
MTDHIRVASKAHTAIRIHSRPKDKEHPEQDVPEHEAVINGNTHASAVNGVGITEGVHAETFHQWIEDHPEHKDLLTEVSDDDLEKHADLQASSGFEPGLEAVDPAGQTEGSVTEHPGPVHDSELKPTSEAPADDSPRSQTELQS